MVSKYVNDHIKNLDTLHKCNKVANSKIVNAMLKQKCSGLSHVYTPNDIQNDMKLNFGMDIPHVTTWMIKEEAIRKIKGDPNESFFSYPYIVTY